VTATNVTEIIEALRHRLSVPTGRHLYAVLGSYPRLKDFAEKLQIATDVTGQRFPAPLSVNRGILKSFPDDRFHELAHSEARYPEEAKEAIGQAFNTFVRASLRRDGLVVLWEMEIVFAYDVDLGPLRAEAADDQRLLLLLPGRRVSNGVELFPEAGTNRYAPPPSLIADNQTWELTWPLCYTMFISKTRGVNSWDIRSLAKKRSHREGELSTIRTCVIRLRQRI
jgi:hypothetical protein